MAKDTRKDDDSSEMKSFKNEDNLSMDNFVAPRNNDSDFDALLEATIIKRNKEIDDNAPSNKATWQAVKEKFIEEGIWEECIFSKIFYWPSKTIDRIIVVLKSFFMLLLGIGVVFMQPAIMGTRGVSDDSDQAQVTFNDIQFEYELIKKEANPISFRQTIISTAIDSKIQVIVNQDGDGDTVLILQNLSPMSDQIILKSLLGLGNQAKGNVRVTIQDAKKQ